MLILPKSLTRDTDLEAVIAGEDPVQERRLPPRPETPSGS